jgi:cytochrome c5
MLHRSAVGAAARVARRQSIVALVVAACLGSTAADAQLHTQKQFVPREETPDEFPDGPGRDETFYLCTACHNFKLVAAQGLNRRQWDESFQLMIDKHGMANIEGDDRKLVLDYLEKTYPPRAPAGGGWQNPFLKR